MTPYARSILKFLSIPFVLSLIGSVSALYMNLHVPPALLWAGAAGLMLSGLVFAYYYAVGELRQAAGVYLPVRGLKRDAKRAFEDLGVKKYLEFYHPRSEDAVVRARLKAKGGVLVSGLPLAGKTRSALEAIAAVLPRAHLLRIHPENFESEIIDKLIVPCPLVFFRKPSVVLFLDNVVQPDAGLIDKLLGRLTEQTSAVYVVSTSDAAAMEKNAEALRKCAHSYLFDPVHLDPLSAEESNRIFAGVWTGTVHPVIGDISLPGYIVLGSNPVRKKILALPEADKKIIRALRLAGGCGAAECEEGFFWVIVEEVLGLKPSDRDGLLTRLSDEGIITVRKTGAQRRISVLHISYLDDAYADVPSFMRDFAQLCAWLVDKGDTKRLAAAGNHYCDVLHDRVAARKLYEKLADTAEPDTQHLMTLTAIYAALGESALEEATLTRALDRAPTASKKAELLITHGDALQYRLARPAESIKFYNRAYYLIENSSDERLLDLVRRRSGDYLLVNRDYAGAEPYFRGWQHGAKGDDLLDASERLTLSLVGQSRDREALELLRGCWRALAPGVRVARALQMLENSEGCLIEDRLTAAARLTVDCLIGPAKREEALKREREEILDFGYQAASLGFARASEMAHLHLAGLAPGALDKTSKAAAEINLGFAQLQLGDMKAAQQSFERAGAVVASDEKLAMLAAHVETGLGDLRLGESKIAEAKDHFTRALRIANEAQDTNMINWAHLGLGEAALAAQDVDAAEVYLGKIERIVEDYSAYLHIWLSLAKVRIHKQQWNEARFLLTRGLSLRARRDYAGLRAEFQKLLDELPKEAGA